MPTFAYKPRSAFDIEARIYQADDGKGKLPHADGETPCLNCQHVKDFHCRKYRKGEKPRTWLKVWNYENPRLNRIVRCKHADGLQPHPPLCSSASCAVADCDCPGFASPFRKLKKPPKPKPPKEKKPRKKRTAKSRTEQLDLLLSPEAARDGMDANR